MSESKVPKGKIKVSFNIPMELMDALKNKAQSENWSQTTALVEAIKLLIRDN
jgi:hypothetical protein